MGWTRQRYFRDIGYIDTSVYVRSEVRAQWRYFYTSLGYEMGNSLDPIYIYSYRMYHTNWGEGEATY